MKSPDSMTAGLVLALDAVPSARPAPPRPVPARPQGLRLLRLVHGLLDLACLGAARPPAFQPTDLSARTAALAERYRGVFERAGLALKVECPPLSAPAHVDRALWDRIVLQLLANAFQFTRQGVVRIALAESDGWIKLTVRDTGAGLDPAAVTRIFARFDPLSGSPPAFGLHLVQGWVRALGGAVCVESQPGTGSVFTVSLREGAAQVPAVPPADRRPVVLLAEPDAGVRAYLTRLLSPRCRVIAFAGEAVALASVRRDAPELVVADAALVRALPTDTTLAPVPVVQLTAAAREALRQESLTLHATTDLLPAGSIEELLAALPLLRDPDVSASAPTGKKLLQRTDRLQFLSELLAQLMNAADAEQLVRELFPRVASHLGADAFVHYTVNAAGDALELRSAAGLSAETLRAIPRLRFGEGICGNVAATLHPLTVDDLQHSDGAQAALARGLGFQTFSCHPLLADGALLGTLAFASHTRPAFDPEEIECMRLISQYAALALDRLRTANTREHLASIVECSFDAIISKTLDGTITSWNLGAERLFGYKAAEIVGQSVLLLIPLDRHAEEAAIIRRIRAGERTDHYETVRRCKDGTLIDVSITVSPLKDAAGRIIGASKIARDITDQKQVQAAHAGQTYALERVLQGIPLPEVLAEILRSLEHRLPGVFASILLFDHEGVRLRHGAAPSLPAAYARAVDELAAGAAPAATALLGSRATFITDIATDPRWADLRALPIPHGLRACWATPIRSSQGRVIGTLVLYRSHPHPPTAREQQMVHLSAQTAAVVIERDTANARRRAQKRDVQFLVQLSLRLAPLQGSREIIREGCSLIGRHFQADRCYISEWSEAIQGGARVGEDWHKAPLSSLAGAYDLGPFGSGAWQKMVMNGYHAFDDVQTHRLTRDFCSGYLALGLRSYATASFPCREGEATVLVLAMTQPRAWRPEELVLLDNALARLWPLVERARGQEAVYESEERLRQGLAAAAMGSWRVDLATGLRTRDANLNRILGYEAVETTLPFGDGPQLVHPEDRAAVAEAWKKAVVAHGSYEAEFRVARPDGGIRWLREQGRTLVDDQGRPTIVTGVTVDVTERKHNDAELLRRTRMLEILNRAGSMLVAERDLEKMMQSVTDAGCEISGAKLGAFFRSVKNDRGESYALCTVSGIPRDEFSKLPLPRITELLAPTFRGGGAMRMGDILADPRYGRNVPSPGMPPSHLPVRSYLAVPVRSHSGAVLGGLFFGHPEPDRFTADSEEGMVALAAQAAIAIDNAELYTALQRELDQQRRTEAALRDSTAQLRLITDSAPVLLAQIDRAHRYKFVNRAYAERYGSEPARIIGLHARDLVGPAAYAAALPHLEKAFAGQIVEFEIEIDAPGGGRRWSSGTYTPERNSTGEIVGVVAVHTDITTRKHAEQEAEGARDRAVAASRAKDEFLAALSHELRTPLNPVLLLASDAAANPALPADVRADFEAIRKNVDLEARLIDDLLDLTRITRGKLPLELRSLDLHHALQDALAIVRPELEAKHLVLDLAFNARQPTVWGDEVRLQQVFWNVLKNAVKFTPRFGRITVQTHNDPALSLVHVRIADTGIGMTPEEQAHVFESFAQGEHALKPGSHRFGGLGLGLAISRMLVELHSGRIHASSTGRDQGAEFAIELPRHEGAVRREPGTGPAWPVTPAPLVTPPGPAPGRRVPILLVEDHAPTRNTLAQLLRRRNYEVLAAASAAEARTLGATREFGLVISDIGLPDGDGYALMTELRALRPGLSGIAMSGYGMEEDIARSRAVGFTAHLTKPVNIATLESAIAQIVGPAADETALPPEPAAQPRSHRASSP